MHSWKHTALAAMTCISGPPWMPGKFILLMALKRSLRLSTRPPRGTTKGLVGGRGHHVAVGHGAGVNAAGDEARDVGHVEQQHGVDLIGDRAEDSRSPRTAGRRWRRRRSSSGARLQRLLAQPVVVDGLGFLVDLVMDGVEQEPGEIDGMAVGQVPAVGQGQAR